MKAKTLGLAFFLLLIASMASAQTIELMVWKFHVQENGSATVEALTQFDSTQYTSAYPLKFTPYYNPFQLNIGEARQLNAFDSNQNLAFSFKNGVISFSPGTSSAHYSATITYSIDSLTSKNGSDWKFRLPIQTISGIQELNVKAYLPGNAQIQSSTPNAIVYASDGALIAEWNLENIPANSEKTLELQYTLDGTPASNPTQATGWVAYGAAAFSVIVVGMLLAFNFKQSKKKSKTKELVVMKPTELVAKPTEAIAPTESYALNPGKMDIMRTLQEREQKVLKALLEEKGNCTQKKLFIKTGLPKATLSRAILALEKKDLIERNALGGTNLITVKKWFLEK